MKKKVLPVVILSILFAMSSLTGCNEEEFQNLKNDYQEQINDLQEQIDGINEEIEDLKSEMTTSINNAKADYQTKIDAANAEISALKTQLSALELKHDQDLKEIEEDYKSKLSILETSLATNVSTLQSLINTQADRVTALQEKHNQDVASLTADYEQKIAAQEELDAAARAALKKELDSAIAALDEELEQQIAALSASTSANTAAIANLTTKHNQDVASVTADYTAKINALEETDAEARQALKEEMEDAITALDEDFTSALALLQQSVTNNTKAISDLVSKHSTDVASVTADYTARINALEEEDVEARNALKEELNAAIAQLDEDFETQLSLLQGKVNDNAAAIANLTTKHNQDVASITEDYTARIIAQEEEDVEARNALKEELNAAIAQLDEDFETQLSLLQGKVNDNTTAIATLNTKHAADIASLTVDYEQKIAAQEEIDAAARASLKAELESSLSTLNAQFTASLLELQTSINDNVTALNNFIAQYTADKQALEKDYTKQVADLDEKYAGEISSISEEISSLRNDIISLTSQMNSSISEIQNDYISKINALTTRVSALEEVQYHTVTFVIEGDNPFSFEAQVVKHGEKAIRPEFAEEDGYSYPLGTTFYVYAGVNNVWEPWYFMSSPVTEDIELHAIANPISYEITLDENYLGAPAAYKLDNEVYTNQNFSCPVPVRDGYVFDGWYKDEVQVTSADGNSLEPFNFASNITLIASWHATSGSGTIDNPFTPEEARQYIEVQLSGGSYQYTSERFYVGGIVASKTTFNEDEQYFSIYFQNEEGTDEKYLQIYHVKLANDIDYNSIQPGYYVIVEGYGSIYNTQYELSPSTDANSNPTTVYFEYRAPVLKGIKVENKTVKEESSIFLNALPIPSYATITETAYWESDSEHVEVGYTSGEVIGVSEGDAEVTVTVGEFVTSCMVKVVSADAGEEYTITVNPSDFTATTGAIISQTISGITFTVSTGTVDNNTMRVFKNNTLTIVIDSGVITKIEMTCTASGTAQYGPGCFVSADDNYTYAGTIGTWTGYESSASFTASTNQVRVTSFKITFIQ